MMTPRLRSFLAIASAGLFLGCANPHFFPRTRPLFPGFDESKMPSTSAKALSEAKVDFQRAIRRQAPIHAQFVEVTPYTRSRVYQGRGYRLTHVDKYSVHSRCEGPHIVLESSLTGGKPYSYDQLDEVAP
jgi:hypothetical protein